MSALTFETLSSELTQALCAQPDTPPETTARCTLGRGKVMVLVEYPQDSVSAEPMATQTLDWLEQSLRAEFDNKGLPDTAADLSESGSEVSVQLFLKHASEAKPFTMRSFIWKVDDGFDDLFGSSVIQSSVPSPDEPLAGRAPRSDSSDGTYAQPVFQRATVNTATSAATNAVAFQSDNPLDASLSESTQSNIDALPSLDAHSELPLDAPLLDAPLEDAHSSAYAGAYAEANEPIPMELEHEHLPLELEPEPDFEAELGVVSARSEASEIVPEIAELDAAHVAPDIAPDIENSLEDSLTLEAPLSLETSISEELALEADVAANLEADLAADLSVDVAPGLFSSGSAAEFVLPGEAPTLDSGEFNLPTLDLPGAKVPDITPADADFFNIDSDAPIGSSLLDSSGLDLSLPENNFGLNTYEASESAFKDAEFDGQDAAPSAALPLESSEAFLGESVSSQLSDLASSDLDAPDLDEPDLDELHLDSSEMAPSDADDEEVDDEEADDAEVDDGESVAAEAGLDESMSDDMTSESVDLEPIDLESTDAASLASALSNSDEPVLDEPVLDEPVLDEPVLEEADSDEPVLDESALDEPAIGASDLGDSNFGGVVSNESSFNETDLFSESLASEAVDRPEPVLPSLEDPPVVNSQDGNFQDANFQMASEAALDDSEVADSEAAELREYDPDAYENAYERGLYRDAETDGESEYDDDPAYYLEEEEVEEEEPFEDVAAIDEGEVQRQREQWQKQSQTNPWIFAGALGFALVGIVGFVATRPCSVGPCNRIQVAQTTSEEAIRDLRTDDSQESVVKTKQQLKRSISLLSAVPLWSPHYRQAQTDLLDYRSQVQALDLVDSAQSKAYQAAVESQNPPHPKEKWQKIANDWLDATESLKSVPADSPVRELANRKLAEYRANRATILVRIDAESKAEVGLRQAQNNASIGTKQLETASSAEEWDEALASWEAAVNNLSQIPQGTKAYAEAQQLLPEYMEKLDEVRSRAGQEISAYDSLVAAKQLAAGAQKAEAEEQWSISIDNWRRAYSTLQDIPEGTLAHAESKALSNLYATSLSQSENNMQVALRFQSIEPNFFAACGVTATQTCTYSVRGGKIRLDLFAGYDAVINQSITPPDQRGGSIIASAVGATNAGTANAETANTSVKNDAEQAVSPQFVGGGNRLLQNITLLGTQAQVPIEMYDSKGDLLATYRPDLEGFTR